jgi:ankyrin repeat protein
MFMFFVEHDSRIHSLVSDSEERTPLHWAVDRGHLNAVEVLVNSDADVNAQVSDLFAHFTHCDLKFMADKLGECI